MDQRLTYTKGVQLVLTKEDRKRMRLLKKGCPRCGAPMVKSKEMTIITGEVANRHHLTGTSRFAKDAPVKRHWYLYTCTDCSYNEEVGKDGM